MITTKQRAELKGMASLIQPAFQIGKGGVNDAQVAQIDDYLRVHELVKIKVLDNSMYTAREAAEEIAEKISAEVVQVIGSKAVLYKRNEKQPLRSLSGIEEAQKNRASGVRGDESRYFRRHVQSCSLRAFILP